MPAWVTTAARLGTGTGGAPVGQEVTGTGAHHHVVATSPEFDGHDDHRRVPPRAESRAAPAPRSATAPGVEPVDVDHHVGHLLVERLAAPRRGDQGRRPGRRPAAGGRRRRPPGRASVPGSARSHTTVPDRRHAAPGWPGRGPPRRPPRPPPDRGRERLGQHPRLLGPERRLAALGEELGHREPVRRPRPRRRSRGTASPRRPASSRPTVVLPAPIMPTRMSRSAIGRRRGGRRRRLAQCAGSRPRLRTNSATESPPNLRSASDASTSAIMVSATTPMAGTAVTSVRSLNDTVDSLVTTSTVPSDGPVEGGQRLHADARATMGAPVDMPPSMPPARWVSRRTPG